MKCSLTYGMQVYEGKLNTTKLFFERIMKAKIGDFTLINILSLARIC
jgi:hypothetical protein